MKPRTVFVGCLVGLISSQLLLPVFKGFLPSYYGFRFANQGPIPSQSLVFLFVALSALLTIAGGYIAAKLEWATTWGQFTAAGFNAGLLAGCLAYMLSGASAAAGVIGQKEILSSLTTSIPNENAGLGLLVMSVVNTTVWVQASFWAIVVPSSLFGTLGSLLSLLIKSPGWRKEPAPKKLGLERLVVNVLGSFGLMNLSILVAATAIMPGAVQKVILENHLSTLGLLTTTDSILNLPLATALVCLMPCLILSIKWKFETWNQPRESIKIKIWPTLTGISALLILLMSLYFLVGAIIPFVPTFTLFSAFSSLLIGSLYFALVALIWFAIVTVVSWMLRKIFRSKETEKSLSTESLEPYTPADYISSALTQGILGATLTTATTVAYALSLVLIAIVDVTHLTLSGAVSSTASEQILSLYTTQMSFNLILIVAGSIIGLGIAVINGTAGTLCSTPAKPVLAAEVSNSGDK